MGRHSTAGLGGYISMLESEAVAHSRVSEEIASTAARATRRALGSQAHAPDIRRRARAYFWAVVRRSAVRTSVDPDTTARFVLAAAIADLQESGRSTDAIWAEIERGWAGRMPEPVLAECRARLCA